MLHKNSVSEQAHVILAVTFGNILEWYEIYSYAYFAPVLARVFLGFHSLAASMSAFFVLFGMGFVMRPLGAVIFGKIGDHAGRKQAFILSIVIMTLPTVMIGCLPSYDRIGLLSPCLLVLLRALQSIPAAGESPGTACFLYEFATSDREVYMTSWSGVGNQIGAILGVVETFLVDHYISSELMVSWGWRISFWIGGLIGLIGLYLRRTLHETPVFRNLKLHRKLDPTPVRDVLVKHRAQLIQGTAYGVVNAASFYYIATYLPVYFQEFIPPSETFTLVASLLVLVPTTALLPLFGIVGDKVGPKVLLVWSTIAIIVTSGGMYIAMHGGLFAPLVVLGILFLLATTCITAMIAYCLCHIFSPSMRLTGVGLSFNLADGLVGGFTPALGFLFLNTLGRPELIMVFVVFMAFISLCYYLRFPQERVDDLSKV